MERERISRKGEGEGYLGKRGEERNLGTREGDLSRKRETRRWERRSRNEERERRRSENERERETRGRSEGMKGSREGST